MSPTETRAEEGKTEETGQGFFAPVRRLLGLGVQAIHVRIGLFAIELREEGRHLVRLLAFAAVFLFLAMATLLMASLALIVCFWDDPHARRVVVASLCAFYAAATLASGIVLCRFIRAERLPFSATLGEFEKDRESIRNSASE